VAAYLDAAARLGVVVKHLGQYHFHPNPTRDAAKGMVDLLEGTWLEYAVFALMQRHARYIDVQMNLRPSQQEDTAFGETDVVCVDQDKTALLLVSCKSTPPKLEHIEALRQRKETLGGRFAHALLCVAHAQDSEKERIAFWCKSLGVELCSGTDIAVRLAGGESHVA
jgi:hypothetical protein